MRMNRRWDKMEKRKLNLREIAQTYVVHNRSEGKSLRTIYWYQQKIASFLSWLEEQGYEPTLENFRPEIVREFLLFLQAKNTRFENNPFTSPKEGRLSTYTVHGYALTLKAFASWLFEEGYTSENVLARLKRPKVAKDLPRHWLRLRRAGDAVCAFFAGERVLWRSADGGQTWQTLETPLGADWRVVDLAADGRLWLLAEHWDTRQARLYRSDDGGSTWEDLGELPQDPEGTASLQAAGGRLWAGLLTRGIYRSADGGRTWREANAGVPSGWGRYAVLRDMIQVEDGSLLAAVESHGQAGILRSTDGGLTWVPALEGLDEGARGDAVQLIKSPYYSQDNTLYVVATGLAFGINPTTRWIYSSTDGGRYWNPLPGSNFDLADFKMAILPTSPQVLLVTRGGRSSSPMVGAYTLADPPTMELSQTALDLLVAKGDSHPMTATLTLNNQGTVPYTYTVASDTPWLRAEPSQGWAPAQVSVIVDPAGMDEGTHEGRLTFASGSDTENSPQEVPVRLRVLSSLFRLFLPLVKVSFWGAW